MAACDVLLSCVQLTGARTWHATPVLDTQRRHRVARTIIMLRASSLQAIDKAELGFQDSIAATGIGFAGKYCSELEWEIFEEARCDRIQFECNLAAKLVDFEVDISGVGILKILPF